MFENFAQFNSVPGMVLLGIIFLAAIGLTLGVASLMRGNETVDHLNAVIGGRATSGNDPAPLKGDIFTEQIARIAKPLTRHTKPRENWERSDLRRRFMQAGWRHPMAAEAFFGAKALLGLGLPALFFIAQRLFSLEFTLTNFLALLGILLLAGYYLPNFWLNRTIAHRSREIFESFPDALDLLTICVEAGLGLEAALSKVAAELRLSSQHLADELEIVTLEMRAGGGKERALRNLAYRTGVEDIEGTVAMLIQSERFGSSIGESLRIQSEMLRVKRMQRAEELAAKIAVKLVFPLCVCILPTIFIVAGGPAMLQIKHSFSQIFGV